MYRNSVNDPLVDANEDVFVPVGTPGLRSWVGPYLLQPRMAVRVGGSGTTVRLTTSIPHDLKVGEWVDLSGFAPAAYNGRFQISAVRDSAHFEVVLKADPGGPASTLGCTTWTDAAPSSRSATMDKSSSLLYVCFG